MLVNLIYSFMRYLIYLYSNSSALLTTKKIRENRKNYESFCIQKCVFFHLNRFY